MLRIALSVLVLLQVYIYATQDRMIFFPQPLDDNMRSTVHKTRPDAEEIELKTADGHRLHGWFVRNSDGAAKAPALMRPSALRRGSSGGV